MSIKMRLLRSKRKEQLFEEVERLASTKSNNFERQLKQVFNVTYTDYCSLRTKRKLDMLITKPHHRMSACKGQNTIKSKTRGDCLKILAMKDTYYTKVQFFQQQNRSKLITKGTILTESRVSRDWLSKKIMQLELLEGKWGEANGHKITLGKQETKSKNKSNRYYFRSLTAKTEQSRPTTTSGIEKPRRQKTLFQRTLHERGLTTLSEPQMIIGWENDTKQFL